MISMISRIAVAIECPVPLIAAAIGARLEDAGMAVLREPVSDGPRSDSPVILAVGSGDHALRRRPASCRGLAVVYLSLEPTLHCLLDALRMDAAAILPPVANTRAIAAVISAVHRGLPIEGPGSLLKAIPLARPRNQAGTVGLSLRQLEVGCSLAQGKSYEQVGEELSITAHAVSFHLRQMRSATGFQDRWHLTAWFNESLRASAYPGRLWEWGGDNLERLAQHGT
ncbi:MAG TPA: LuxR C-terminal-related transcriptional regulator [Chloroflexota bacterium]|nr:LuxR C-terminal-related transcriptional regulator [Chloroflexota bacterium]